MSASPNFPSFMPWALTPFTAQILWKVISGISSLFGRIGRPDRMNNIRPGKNPDQFFLSQYRQPCNTFLQHQPHLLALLSDVDDVLAASICMRDGHATPDAVVLGYATAARAMGVEIATRCPVTGIDLDAGAITGVRTPRGTVSTSKPPIAPSLLIRPSCSRYW